MPSHDFIPQLIRLAVAILVPTIACFGLYRIAELDPSQGYLATPVILAYPLMLIGAIGLFRSQTLSASSRRALFLWSLVILLPLMLLIVVHEMSGV